MSPVQVCVPASCETSPTSPNCALDWTYQSGLCRDEASSVPDASFHYVLAVLALLLLSILTVPIYWGAQCTKVHTLADIMYQNILTTFLVYRSCMKTSTTFGQN